MIFLGCMAAIFSAMDFVSSFKKFIKLDMEGGRWDSLESAVWFTAAMICFK